MLACSEWSGEDGAGEANSPRLSTHRRAAAAGVARVAGSLSGGGVVWRASAWAVNHGGDFKSLRGFQIMEGVSKSITKLSVNR